jgi:hypothetical protein
LNLHRPGRHRSCLTTQFSAPTPEPPADRDSIPSISLWHSPPVEGVHNVIKPSMLMEMYGFVVDQRVQLDRDGVLNSLWHCHWDRQTSAAV